jgi:hypothetical protein
MKDIFNAILKFLLGKTKLDETLADELGNLKEKVETMDKIDGDTEIKEETKEEVKEEPKTETE